MQSSATEVVKRWGEYLDQVRSGESVTITSHGRPVVRLLPPPREATAAELEAKLASLPHGAAVAAAVEAARAVMAEHDLALDRPYLLRAAAALATGAYREGNLSPGAEAARKAARRAATGAARRAAMLAEARERWGQQRAAAPDPGAAA